MTLIGRVNKYKYTPTLVVQYNNLLIVFALRSDSVFLFSSSFLIKYTAIIVVFVDIPASQAPTSLEIITNHDLVLILNKIS